MQTEDLAKVLADVTEGWVPGRIYTDPQIFDEERKKLFTRSWQFLAHESEVPKKNDYVVRSILEDSFIVARGADGEVRAFLNICRHRGGQVCRNESGNTRRFVCPYHSWAFKTNGELAGVPYHEEAYGGEEVLPRKEFGLIEPRTEKMFGMVFVNLDADAPTLAEAMGDYAKYMAFYMSNGKAEVRGPQRWRFKANWKVGPENFSGDTYHTPHTHASVGAIGLVSNAATSNRKAGVTFYTGNGCGGATFFMGEGGFDEKLASIGYPDAQRKRMAENVPTEIQHLISDQGLIPSASTFFPNLSFLHLWARIGDDGELAPFTTLRVFAPISATEAEMYSWFVVDSEASEEFKQKSQKAYVMCFGTSGMFEQDDMDAWVTLTRTSRGYLSRQVHFHNRMGLGPDGAPLKQPEAEFPGPGIGHRGFNEHNQRQWLGHWAAHLRMSEPSAAPLNTSEKKAG